NTMSAFRFAIDRLTPRMAGLMAREVAAAAAPLSFPEKKRSTIVSHPLEGIGSIGLSHFRDFAFEVTNASFIVLAQRHDIDRDMAVFELILQVLSVLLAANLALYG